MNMNQKMINENISIKMRNKMKEEITEMKQTNDNQNQG